MMNNDSLAIIGMACHLPGAKNIDEFWKLIYEGRSAITKIPSDRMDYDLYFDAAKGKRGKTYMDQAGLIDYPAFNISNCRYPVHQAENLDVVHMEMCQTAAWACRHAGMNPFNLSVRHAGVYVGNNVCGKLSSDLVYGILAEHAVRCAGSAEALQRLAPEAREAFFAEVVAEIRAGLPTYGPDGAPTVKYQLTAGAVSDSLGLDGPAIVVDAACSSSLQALAIAARDLRTGSVDMAFVGGASFFSEDSLMIFSAAQSGSAKGCCPFSDNADGLIPAEGNVCIIMKTLDRALADGDPIQAVVKNIGVSSDGKGKSLWAPQSEGQYEAIMNAYPDPEDMTRLAYLEAHATSTAVGDQTELRALEMAFSGKFTDGKKRPVGGIKANIGHALEAAGLAGLLKAVLVMQKNTVPQQIACQPLNKKVDWEKMPFFVPLQTQTLMPSTDGRARLAGVNSFGIGGLNVHVSLEEALPGLSRSTSVAVKKVAGEKDGSCEPVAVIGMGTIFPGARTLADFERFVFSLENPKTEVTEDRWSPEIGFHSPPDAYHTDVRTGGFVRDFEYDWRRHRVPPKQLATGDPLQFMILDCTDAALADAGYDKKDFDRLRCGVIVGSSFDNDFGHELGLGFRTAHTQRVLCSVLKRHGMTDDAVNREICEKYAENLYKKYPAIMDETGSFTPSSLSSRVSKTYDCMGGAMSIESGDTVSLATIADAVNTLRTGEKDMVICAAGARLMGLPAYVRMSLAGETPADGVDTVSGLDAGPGGDLPAEGAGVLVLKRLSDAVRDGDRIHAVVHGVGCAGVPENKDPEKIRQAYGRAIRRAWGESQDAGAAAETPEVPVKKKTVVAVELSSAPRDVLACELAALEAHYAGNAGGLIPVGETRAQFGYLRAASGMASLVKGIMEVNAGKMPALYGFRGPGELAKRYEGAFAAPVAEAALAGGEGVSGLAAVCAWDPLGYVYHAVFERYRPGMEAACVPCTESVSVADGGEDSAYRVVRLAAGSYAELREVIAGADAEKLFRETKKNVPAVNSAVRMAVVAENPADLAEKLHWALENLEGPHAEKLLQRKGIFVAAPAGKPGKVAFLFSGQGSQYAGMLRGLVECFAPAKKAAAEMDAVLMKMGLPTFETLMVTDGEMLGEDVFRTQLSLLCADTLLWHALHAVGIRPDVISSHSYGEFPAMHACGVWDFENAALATKIRCETILRCTDTVGGMLSTNVDGADAERVCAQFPGEAFPANYNAPDQTVIGGKVETLEKIAEILKTEGKMARIIPVPRPFHTPLMASTEKILYDGLAAVDFQQPVLPVLSSVTNKYLKDGAEVRRNLAAQMTGPVRFVELIRRLAEDGVTLFVECGPKRVLTSLAAKILGDSPVKCWAADDPQKGDGYQLMCLRAWYEVNGYADRAAGKAVVHAGNNEELLARIYELADSADGSGKSVSGAEVTAAAELAAALGVLPETVMALHAAEKTPAGVADNVPEGMNAALVVTEAVFKKRFRDGTPPQAKWGMAERKYCRFEPRLVESPLPVYDPKRLNLSGHVLIYGDNPVARALEGKLAALGQKVTVLACSGDWQQDAQKAAEACEAQSCLNLFLVAVRDAGYADDHTPRAWEKQREMVLGTYAVTQAWFRGVIKNKGQRKASVCAMTRLGGDFGFSGGVHGRADGALCGMMKSLEMEVGLVTDFTFRAKCVDFPESESADGCAEKLLETLAANVVYEVESCWKGGKRYVTRVMPVQAVESSSSKTPAGAWIVTGGGRGITAFVARNLAKKFGLAIHVIGSSPAPEIAPAWRNLDEAGLKKLREEVTRQAAAEKRNPLAEWNRVDRALKLDASLRQYAEVGVKMVYHHCDQTDVGKLAETVSAIRAAGPITGILHGAGMEVSTGFEKKDMQNVEKTWAIKTDGLVNLLELTKNDPLAHVVGFGSMAGRLGSVGQTDYSMANDAMAKILDLYAAEHPDCAVSCFHWGPWDEIGMAVRPEMRRNPVLQHLTFLPPGEGLAYVMEELAAQRPLVEKLIGGWDHVQQFYPLPDETAENVPVKPAEVKTPESAPVEKPAVTAPENAPTSGFLMRRMEPVMVDIPAWSQEPFQFTGNAIIYGDNACSQALRSALNRQGVEVLILPETELPLPGPKTPVPPLLEEMGRFCEKAPAPHLFIMSGRNPEGLDVRDAAACAYRRHVGLMTPLQICRQWLRRMTKDGLMAQATLVAGTLLGGDCGFSGREVASEGAAVAGILKNVHLENGGPQRDGVTVRIVDAPLSMDPVMFAEAMIAELSSPELGLERCVVNGKRRAPRVRSVPVEAYPREEIPRGGTWVFTGGGRGITAETARVLGMKYGLKVNLLGTSPVPVLDENIRYLTDEQLVPLKKQVVKEGLQKGLSPEKAWGSLRKALEIDRNLRKMRDAGLEAEYYQCDVTDAKQLATVLDAIRAKHGPIQGVIHGAGIDGNPATVRDMQDSLLAVDEKLTEIKAEALVTLWNLLKNDPLRYFVGFASISGRFGSASAGSYSAGNDMLCKFFDMFRLERPETRVFAVHWHAWGEIGMMMRPASYGSIKILKMQLMPPEEGIAHLENELCHRAPCGEIAVTDSQYYTIFWGPEMSLDDDDNGVGGAQVESVGALVNAVERVSDTEFLGRAVMKPAEAPFLLDHRLRQRPLLPAVITSEMLFETARRAERVVAANENMQVTGMAGLGFKEGFRFTTDAPQDVRVKAVRKVEGVWECRLVADFYNTKGQLMMADRLYSQAEIVTAAERPLLMTNLSPVLAPGAEWHPVEYLPPEGAMYHGPVFQQLQRCAFLKDAGAADCWGEVKILPLADFAGPYGTQGWEIPASTLDACLYLCGVSVWYYSGGSISLPKTLGRLKLGQGVLAEGSRAMIHCRQVESRPGEAVFRFALFNESGEVVLTGEDYCCQVIRS